MRNQIRPSAAGQVARPQACLPQERKQVARPEGFEPPTFWFVARRSIQLSYERTGSKTILEAGRSLVNAPANVHWRFLSPLGR